MCVRKIGRRFHSRRVGTLDLLEQFKPSRSCQSLGPKTLVVGKGDMHNQLAFRRGDGKCVLCPTYPLPERRFPLEDDEHRHRLSQIRPRLIAREQANAVVGCANLPHPFPRGRGRCCTKKSESCAIGEAEDYPRRVFEAGRLFRNLPCAFRRLHQQSQTHHAVVVMPWIVASGHRHLLR